jgi:ABC-type polysaccharide/polyol phosphate export systems, permease component
MNSVPVSRFPAFNMLATFVSYRRILAAITQVELAKKYSGSMFGRIWIVLYPILLLSIYLFVYMAVFQMRFSGSGRLDYVLYVFAALIPYIGFMEAVTSGCVAIKQNMHLVKNVMLPIELIPARYVLVAMTGQLVGMLMLIVLVTINGGLTARLLSIPIMLLLQAVMLIGIVMILAPLAVVLPDVAHFVNLGVLLLIFVSPIGFRPDMIHGVLSIVIYANPISYMIQSFRSAVLREQPFDLISIAVFAVISVGCFALGSWFFGRFKRGLVEFE